MNQLTNLYFYFIQYFLFFYYVYIIQLKKKVVDAIYFNNKEYFNMKCKL